MRRKSACGTAWVIAFALVMLCCCHIAEAQTDRTVSTDETWPAGEYAFATLTITNNARLTLQSDTGASGFKGVSITAENLVIDAGSAISANGQGYGPGTGPGAGADGVLAAGGGGYGGAGGTQSGGSYYGSATAPPDLGSGGGRDSYFMDYGGAGGGAVRLVVTGTLTNNGVVSASGADARNGNGDLTRAGGGSGGSIYVTTNALAGSGLFRANGGA